MATNILASSIVVIGFLVIFAIIYYVMGARGMKAQKQHFQELHASLSPGRQVKFSNGMYGLVKAINQKAETVDIQVKSGAIVEVSRYAISDIVK